MPKITRDKEDLIWQTYQKYHSYTATAKELGFKDWRTVKRVVVDRKQELARNEQQLLRVQEESAKQKEDEARKRRTKAFSMFKGGRSLKDVAIELGLDWNEAKDLDDQYLKMTNRQTIVDVYSKFGEKGLETIVELSKGISIRNVGPDKFLKFYEEHVRWGYSPEKNVMEKRISQLNETVGQNTKDMEVMEELIGNLSMMLASYNRGRAAASFQLTPGAMQLVNRRASLAYRLAQTGLFTLKSP